MLYLAHFSFETVVPEVGPRHGVFDYLIEGSDINAVLPRLKRRMIKLKKDTDVFHGIDKIELDSVLEISRLPRAGVLAQIEIFDSERPVVLLGLLPANGAKGCTAFMPGKEPVGGGEFEETVKLFLVFDEEGEQDG